MTPRSRPGPRWQARGGEEAGQAAEFQVLFTTSAQTVTGRNLARDNRIALSVDDPAPPYSFAVLEGTAEFSDDPVELIVRVTLARIVAQRDIAE